MDRTVFEEKLRANIEEKNTVLKKIYGHEELDINAIIGEYLDFDVKIDPYIKDTTLLLNQAITDGKSVLMEGAQGALLDVDHGTYPFVTSSNPTSGGACTGLGVPPTKIDSVIGVVKAYTTRVGMVLSQLNCMMAWVSTYAKWVPNLVQQQAGPAVAAGLMVWHFNIQ